MIVLIPNINLLKLSWIIICLIVRNMGSLIILLSIYFQSIRDI